MAKSASSNGFLSDEQRACLVRFGAALVDQERARVIVEPMQRESGFWFGGGNMTQGPNDVLYLVGRFRNAGDSRRGISVGERGFELAVYASEDHGESFEKLVSFSKEDFSQPGKKVLSIEGAALHVTPNEVELFVSTEKDGIGYPKELEDFLKPGTGVWTIDRLAAKTISDLPHSICAEFLSSNDPESIHVKDPSIYKSNNGDVHLLFCSHPFCWTSSNTGYAIRPQGNSEFDAEHFSCMPRGSTWDVAITRGTCLLNVPQVGPFEGREYTLLFYDGGECVRLHESHANAVARPRGHSCEEIGGLAVLNAMSWRSAQRLSSVKPLFVSPHGSGCSRYVNVLETDDGYYATWQQSQRDDSQPLVLNFLPRHEAEAILADS